MIRKLLLAAVLLGLATPSYAGFGLMCSGGNGVSADFPLGGGAGVSLLGATINVGDEFWSTDITLSGGTQIVPAQAAQIDDRYYIDLADPGMERVVVRVRLFSAAGVDETIWGGTLEIFDRGAYAISCTAG